MSQVLPKLADHEREKYEKVWENPAYRRVSPGELSVMDFLYWSGGIGEVVDLGCGTGRAAGKIATQHAVVLVDHAANCRDEEVKGLPFYQQCLWELDLPKKYEYGFCCDVMEHIPPSKVDFVLERIAMHCWNVYFRIFLNPDNGKFSDEPLHLTVQPAEWWEKRLAQYWPSILVEADPNNSNVATFKCRK